MHDHQFVVHGNWALASDGVQWILQRRWKDGVHRSVSFVRSTKDILERCMREKGVENVTASFLLAGLPDTFDAWKATQTFSNGQDEASGRR